MPSVMRPGPIPTPTRRGRQAEAEGFFDIDAGDELLRGITMAGLRQRHHHPVGCAAQLRQADPRGGKGGGTEEPFRWWWAATTPSPTRWCGALGRFEPLNIVHFDAHLDYSHDYQGALQTHGSPIRRCRELPFVHHITSVGIRTARRQPYEDALEHGSLIITTSRFRELGPVGVAELDPPGENLYVTFDIDVMDPSQAPGTGTPEIGGLFYQEARECLTSLVERNNLIGFDLVEVAPPYDSSEITAQLGARLIIDILAARFPSKPVPADDG